MLFRVHPRRRLDGRVAGYLIGSNQGPAARTDLLVFRNRSLNVPSPMRKDGIRCRLCVERVATLKVINRAAGSGGGNDTLRQQSRREADLLVALPSSPNALPCPQSLTRHRQGLSSLAALGLPLPDLAKVTLVKRHFCGFASYEQKSMLIKCG